MQCPKQALGIVSTQVASTHAHRPLHQVKFHRRNIGDSLDWTGEDAKFLDVPAKHDGGTMPEKATVFNGTVVGKLECLAAKVDGGHQECAGWAAELGVRRPVGVDSAPGEQFAQHHGRALVANGEDGHAVAALTVARDGDLDPPPTKWSP